ncbi:MFS transporter [Actinomadura kijaniata]|uniref:MFS transporter n=1 Tax=Actinomadura kijaniata TaxID=46161 RepID=UPI003F198AAC
MVALGAFGRLWTAASVSALGDGVTLVAGPLLAATLTRDPVRVAGLTVAQMLPGLLFALHAGALVDRWDRRWLTVGTSLLRMAALGLLSAAVLAGGAGLPLLYGVFFLVGCAGLVFDNAAATLVPAVVAPARLEQANGRLQAGRMLGEQLAAKPFGAWLFAVAAWSPFLLDAVGLLLVAALAATLPANVNTAPRVPLRTAVGEGVRWLLRQRLLRMLAWTVAVSNVGLGAVSAVLVLIAHERLGVGAVGYGLLLAALAVGGGAGGLLAGRIVRLAGPGTVLRAGLVVETLVHLGAGATRNAVVAGLLLALMGLHLVVFSAIVASVRQSLVPAELLGRVHGAYRLVTVAGLLAGAVCGGLLARHAGLVAPFWLGAGCGAVLVVGAWRTLNDRDVRAAREGVGPPGSDR